MRLCTVAITLTLMACVDLAGCDKGDTRLPAGVTTAVSRDFNRGDADGTASNYTDDAQILVARYPAIVGKDAIAAYFKTNIDKYLGLGNQTTWSTVKGDMAVEQGVYNVRNVQVGEDVETGKYIRIWKRVNGSWKLYRDMFSADSEVSAAVSVSPEETVASDNTPKPKK
jgi:ketosteroid isomerase-like protein